MGCIGSLILVLALLILFHQNANATRGYQLRTLERERSRLLLDEELLQMKVAQAQALEKLIVDNSVQAMIPYKNPVFSHEESTVAQRSL